MYDKNNIFAKILRKEIPSKIIYEDKNVLFFYDVNPQAKLHILGIPKMEVINFDEFVLQSDPEQIKHFFSIAFQIIKEKKIDEKGYKIITNTGEYGGQEVPHFHIHILGGEKIY